MPFVNVSNILLIAIDCHCQLWLRSPSVVCFAKCIPTLHPSRRTYFHSSLREEEGGKCQVEEEHEEEDEEEEEEKEEEKEEEGVSALHVTGSMSWKGGGAFGCREDVWHPPLE